MALGVSPRILCAQAGPPGGAGEISQHPTTRVCGGGVCVGAEAMAAAPASHVASEMKTTAVQCPKTRATSQEARGSGARDCPATQPTAAVRDGCPRFPFWNSRRHANSSAGRGRGGTQAARARGGRLGRCVWELGIMRPSTGPNLTATHQKNGRTRRRHRAVPEPRPQPQPAGASARPPRVRPARRGRAPRREGEGSGGLRPPKPGENANVRQPPKVQTTVGSARCAHRKAEARRAPGRSAARISPCACVALTRGAARRPRAPGLASPFA